MLFFPSITIAQCTPVKLDKKEARAFYHALRKALKTKSSKISFDRVECAYHGPGAGDVCHDCKGGKDAKGKSCQTCAQLQPTGPEYCVIDQSKLTSADAGMQEFAKLLKANPHGGEGAMGGWSSDTTQSGFCESKGHTVHCEYCYVNP